MRINRKLVKSPFVVHEKPFIFNEDFIRVEEKSISPLVVPLKKEKYDIVICASPKDYFKLKYCISSVFKYLKDFDGIYVISPTEILDKMGINSDVRYFVDDEVLSIPNKERLKYRPGWVCQQFLKLFQKISKNNYYLTVDSDIVFNRELEFFTQDGHPIWYSGWEQEHQPYFTYQRKMIGVGKTCPQTFICDMNFFNKSIIEDMLDRFGYTVDSFIQKSIEIISPACYIAEPEIYGSYVTKYFPDLYRMVKIKNTGIGRSQNTSNEKAYTTGEFEQILEEYKHKDFDIIAVHSWFDERPNNR